MADRKGKSSHKRNKRRSTTFAQFKGKIIDRVEAHITDYGCAIGIMFDDRTYLCFEVERGGVTILPDLSDWKTGELQTAKAMEKNFRLKLEPAAKQVFSLYRRHALCVGMWARIMLPARPLSPILCLTRGRRNGKFNHFPSSGEKQ